MTNKQSVEDKLKRLNQNPPKPFQKNINLRNAYRHGNDDAFWAIKKAAKGLKKERCNCGRIPKFMEPCSDCKVINRILGKFEGTDG